MTTKPSTSLDNGIRQRDIPVHLLELLRRTVAGPYFVIVDNCRFASDTAGGSSWMADAEVGNAAMNFSNVATKWLRAAEDLAVVSVDSTRPRPIPSPSTAPHNLLADLAEFEVALRGHATRLGIDFDKLIEDAASHFGASAILPSTEKVPNAVIWQLAVDDIESDD